MALADAHVICNTMTSPRHDRRIDFYTPRDITLELNYQLKYRGKDFLEEDGKSLSQNLSMTQWRNQFTVVVAP
jgi:hypothetical protein